jgi:resuscitation-promoting factor RpfB
VRKSILVAAGTAAVLAVGVGGTAAYATKSKNVTVSVDGQVQKVHTFGSTVEDALKSKGITVGEHDVVAPSLDAKLTDGQEIAVQFARQLTVNADGTKKVFWTTEDSVSEALDALGLRYDNALLSTSRSAAIGREGLALTVRTAKTITIVRAGKPKKIKTVGLTVSEALAKAKVRIDGDDKVTPALTTPVKAGTRIVVIQVQRKNIVQVVSVPFTTTKTKSASLYEGDTKTTTEGKPGKQSIGYAIVLHDGKLAGKKKVATKLLVKPVAEVVVVGTKPKPETPEPADPPTGDTSAWDRIAECESGGNWSINTGNGYYGGLQFSKSTWDNYGGDVYAAYPHQASKAQQIAIAEKVRAAEGGYGAWPHCGGRA